MSPNAKRMKVAWVYARSRPSVNLKVAAPGQPDWAGDHLSLVRIILDLRFLILDSLVIDDLRLGIYGGIPSRIKTRSPRILDPESQ
jgi:hypothetical protein